jgi:hypothetical protein
VLDGLLIIHLLLYLVVTFVVSCMLGFGGFSISIATSSASSPTPRNVTFFVVSIVLEVVLELVLLTVLFNEPSLMLSLSAPESRKWF